MAQYIDTMTKEEKQLLLLKDLCARLPYGVRVKLNGRREKSNQLTINWLYTYSRHIEDIKPYLRPMSSMTDKEKDEYDRLVMRNASWVVDDWLNSHHLDYRGLIPKGLALEATEGMYK